ncbi:hypothetical protein AAFO92_06675 [Roseovarius sp. CAU 1744]|uniref:hypothetical protein n=1 Tax=Roseovarius sp. CAU 1744 TaxID=3140368 RepID=UPI00325AAE17
MTIRRWALAIIAVVAGWLAVLSAVMIFTDAAPGAIVFFPREGFVGNLPTGAAVVGGGGIWLAVRSDDPGLGRALYRAGGRLVLPAGLPGCLPLPAR